jgi:LPXTG-motif cell wall-anchored protein
MGIVRTAWERTWVRAGLLLLVVLAGGAVALTVDLPSVSAVRGWLDDAGQPGFVALALGVGLALLAPVPRTALSVLLGLVAGFWTGLAVALGGAMLGGLTAFALSRWLGRGAAVTLAGQRLARVDEFVGERGFVSVLTGRLIPVVPFTLLSYAAGLTGVRLLPYAAATAVGLVPSTVVQVGVGASAPFVLDRLTGLTVVPVAAGAALLGVLGALFWRRRKRRAGRPVEEVAA